MQETPPTSSEPSELRFVRVNRQISTVGEGARRLLAEDWRTGLAELAGLKNSVEALTQISPNVAEDLSSHLESVARHGGTITFDPDGGYFEARRADTSEPHILIIFHCHFGPTLRDWKCYWGGHREGE
jgi:hypothetical protein